MDKFETVCSKLDAGADRHRIVERILATDANKDKATKRIVTIQKVRLILGITDLEARALVSEMMV